MQNISFPDQNVAGYWNAREGLRGAEQIAFPTEDIPYKKLRKLPLCKAL